MPSPKRRILQGWVHQVERYPWWVLICLSVINVLAGFYTHSHLHLNTSTSQLFSHKLPWRQAEARLDRAFPQLNDNLVIVIDAATPALAAQATARLGRALQAHSKRFPYVYLGADEPFLRHNGLLFRSKASLQDLSQRLVQAQPLLGQLVRAPDVGGLVQVLDRVMKHTEGHKATFMLPLLRGMHDVFAAAAAGRQQYLAWQTLLGAEHDKAARGPHVLLVRPKLNYDAVQPAQKALQMLKQLTSRLQLTPRHGVSIHLTGPIAFQHHERASLMRDLPLFAALSLVLVTALLFAAMRSWQMVLAAVLTLIPGLIWTTTFATVAVGRLNLLSIAFVLLYVGLGIDYAIHLCMAYREARIKECPHREAMHYAVHHTGISILSSALTTALALYVFMLTPFTALGNLGLIAGTGMLISLLMTFTLLPALLSLLEPRPFRIKHARGWAIPASWRQWPRRHRGAILVVALAVGIAAILTMPALRFQVNPIEMRDAHSEAVRTFKYLMRAAPRSPLPSSVLVPNAEAAQRLQQRAKGLPQIAATMSLASWVPAHQNAKLAIISRTSLLLGPIVPPGFHLHHPKAAQQVHALRQFRRTLRQFESTAKGATARAARLLRKDIDTLVGAASTAVSPRTLQRLEIGLLAGLPETLRRLQQSLQAQRITAANLPKSIKRRWITSTGVRRVVLYARENLMNNHALEHFVAAVTRLAPHASGAPVVMVRAAAMVIRAFYAALAYTALLTFALLWLTFRNVRDPILVLLPIVLAGLLTCAAMVVLGEGFNYANVIALPLLLGAGIDYGIHIVARARSRDSREYSMWSTTTPRAVLYSALSTLVGFGNLAFTGHGGPASMGLVLALGLGFIVLTDILLLPVLLMRRRHHIQTSS